MRIKYSNDPPPSIKQAMLLTFAGLFPYNTNPPVDDGKENRRARGFWLCDAEGKVTQVSGRVWTEAFPSWTRLRRGISGRQREQEAWRAGGRIIIGLGKRKDEQDLVRIDAQVPSLISDVAAPELKGAGWTTGRFGFGYYVSKDRTLFDDRSTVVQIAGIDSEKLAQIALLLARDLGQTTVMVFDDNDGGLLLTGPGAAQVDDAGVQELDAMTRSYLEAALWAETEQSTGQDPEPPDKKCAITDFAPESVAKAVTDCAAFEQKAGSLLHGIERRGHDVADVIGFNFWLVRNGHRAGFWEGDYLKDVSEALTTLAREFGAQTVLVGGDGQLHIESERRGK
jgi:hypothetical protein